MESVLVDFCARCASVLPEGLGKEDNPLCPSCYISVDSRDDRAQGIFSYTDAYKLKGVR